MDDNKKKIFKWIGVSFIILIIIFIFIQFNRDNKINNNEAPIDKVGITVSDEQDESIKNTIEFVSSIYGLEVNYLKVINDPVGFKGGLMAPKDTVINGLDYIIKNIVRNEKLEDVGISLGEGSATINVIYKVTDKIKTPVEMTIVPKLTKDKDLQIEIKDVKFLDIKIFKWLVDFSTSKFVKEWIPKGSGFKVGYKDGSILIDKSNFNGISFNDISITSQKLNLDITFDLENIMINIANKSKK